MKQSPGRGNSGFEIAATYYAVTGKRDLLDPAIQSADALYDNFKVASPALFRRRAGCHQLRAVIPCDAR